MSGTTAVNSGTDKVSCFQKVIDSKWTDLALVIGIVAFALIGVLCTVGVFNFIGTTNALYLSYGAYAGAALLAIAEVIKLVLNYCCAKKEEPKRDPLTPEEISNLENIMSDWVFKNAEPMNEKDTNMTWGRLALQGLIKKTLGNPDFQNDPTTFLKAQEKSAMKYPQNKAWEFLNNHIHK
jgi:hypothetical protein